MKNFCSGFWPYAYCPGLVHHFRLLRDRYHFLPYFLSDVTEEPLWICPGFAFYSFFVIAFALPYMGSASCEAALVTFSGFYRGSFFHGIIISFIYVYCVSYFRSHPWWIRGTINSFKFHGNCHPLHLYEFISEGAPFLIKRYAVLLLPRFRF